MHVKRVEVIGIRKRAFSNGGGSFSRFVASSVGKNNPDNLLRSLILSGTVLIHVTSFLYH